MRREQGPNALRSASVRRGGVFDAGMGMTRHHSLGTATPLKHDSFSITQEGCDDARIAATVKYGQDKEGFFIRSVHDQKIAYGMKTQRSRSQIGASVAYLRKGD
jgi:hypothetical protein